MGDKKQQENEVKEGLFEFIKKNIPSADVTIIDEIVLSYVISIIEEASHDPNFDVEEFIDMMAGFIPRFDSIEPGLVCAWLLEQEAELCRREEAYALSEPDDSAVDDMMSLNVMLPSITRTIRSRTNSDSSEYSESLSLVDRDEYSVQYKMLLEMFPNTCAMEIKHCLSIACGDASRAASTLLHRREQGQAMCTAVLHAAARNPCINDRELKSRIIDRYSYVDRGSETREHRPVGPRMEPRKMVRYRDNKIVSLKGEKYTEVPKSGNDEDNLKKPKKHCP